MSARVSDEPWTLTPAELVEVMGTRSRTRLGYAVLLTFFREHGRFPRAVTEVDRELIVQLARELGTTASAFAPSFLDGRTARRLRARIREWFGFREASVADAAALQAWARESVAPEAGGDVAAVVERLETCCREQRLVPPSARRLDRIARAALREYDDRIHAEIHGRLPATTARRLDALLRSGDEAAVPGDADPPPRPAPAVLLQLRDSPGPPTLASVRETLAKLARVRDIALPAGLFDGASARDIERWRQRVAVEAPHELRRHAPEKRLTWLAAFVCTRTASVTDDLVDLLIDTVHRIGARAERKVERELLDDLKRVSGKQNLLFELADVTLNHPDGVVRDVVFPVVGEQTSRDLVREWKAAGPTYRTTLRTVIRKSYRGHYRRMVPELLAALDFRSNNRRHRPVLEALGIVRRFAGTRVRTYPVIESVPLDGVVRGLWREAAVETDGNGQRRINRITYEIAVLEALRERLRSREIWVVGANRYRNPDEDLPADFERHRDQWYEALALPLDADAFVDALRDELREGLERLDRGLMNNGDVRIGPAGGGRITVSPLDPQPEPPTLAAFKAELTGTWPMTSLLDMVKETDLRLRFTDELRSPTAFETLDRTVLQQRLLLCLHGLGTNAGLQRMASLESGVSAKDLAYVRRRYVTGDALRRAIAVVTNGTLRSRQPAVWGDGTTACASDSKHFGAWDQNLTTQWHARYGGRGIMIYWHVERKSLCIHSQLKSPSSSEVAAMIEGVIHHCTEMEVDRQYVDSHGQSTVAFAFARLLGFELLPRLKAIHAQKLYRPDKGRAADYPRLQHVLTRPINWALVRQQYDEMVRYTTALRLGVAETESILRRFTRKNVQHPTYKALAELGKAVKTIFLCRYLDSKTLRREIHEGLNVVEQWNGATDFVFFARRGELASNRREDHEISMLALHLIQNCMVYVNTLMIQSVLERPRWQRELTARDYAALTPLIWAHVNPYGRFELDMDTRLALR